MPGTSYDIRTLNSLIASLIDSVNGFEKSAEDNDNPRFAQLFEENARERRQVVRRLQDEVRRLGGNPEDDGTVAAAAHRTFIDLKSAITSRDDKAIINEVERGEDHLKDKFEEALRDDDLSPQARSVIEQAYPSVRRGHDQARDLKHALEGAA